MSEELEREQGAGRRGFARRGVFLSAIAAAAGAVLGKRESAEAASGEPMILGAENVADRPTELFENGMGSAFVAHHRTADPPGGVPPVQSAVSGFSDRFGLLGSTLSPAETAISATPDFRAGVTGFSDRFGLLGSTLSPAETAFTATPDFQAGVTGFSDRFGVLGSTLSPSQAGISATFPQFNAGVVGAAFGSRDIAVFAENPSGGRALRAQGRIAFSTAGRGVFRADQMTAQVMDPAIREDSLVSALLLGDPGASGIMPQYAEVSPGAFTLFLTRRAKVDTPFAYFVYEQAGH